MRPFDMNVGNAVCAVGLSPLRAITRAALFCLLLPLALLCGRAQRFLSIPRVVYTLILFHTTTAFPLSVSSGKDWTIACSDGSTASGTSPFAGDVRVATESTCSFTFRVVEGLSLDVGGSVAHSTSISAHPVNLTNTFFNEQLSSTKAELGAKEVGKLHGRQVTDSSSDITVTSGSFAGEVSWTVSCPSGVSVSGGAPFSGSMNAVSGEICTLNMIDSFGDGWNGAVWSGLEQSFTLASGSSGTETFQIPFTFPTPPLVPPMPPSRPPPFTPPPLPSSPPFQPLPAGFRGVRKASDIRDALRYPRASVSLHLQEGSRLPLGGAQVAVHQSNVTISSDGSGAIIDAEGLSRHFDVALGGRLHLENLHLLNGGFEASGGSVLVRNGGTLTTSNVNISDSRVFSTLTAVCHSPLLFC